MITCQHGPGEPACVLPACNGTPPADEPMDRDVFPIGLPSQVLSGGRPHLFVPKLDGDGSGPEYCVDPCHRHRTDAAHGASASYEMGNLTAARALVLAVAAETGFRADNASVAENGWSDTRQGRRKVHGLMFTLDDIDVRVLSYEARTSPLDTWRGWWAAVYVGDVLVEAAVDQERPTAVWQHAVVQAIAREAERQHDARLLALPADEADWCLLLKNPPVGMIVDVPDRGNMTVHEPSTNDGMTLRVLDRDGNYQFIDRRAAGVWMTSRPRPPAAAPTAVHVLSSSPTVVKFTNGLEGLANPTWCGRTRLPDGERACHVYGLKPTTITCPTCFHLFTCPWAALDGDLPGQLCGVCAHVLNCVDETCNPAGHPGIVPEPALGDVVAAADLVVARIRQAIADGEHELAAALLDAGDDQRLGAVGDSELWDELRVVASWAREQAAEQPGVTYDDDAGVLWASVLGR